MSSKPQVLAQLYRRLVANAKTRPGQTIPEGMQQSMFRIFKTYYPSDLGLLAGVTGLCSEVNRLLGKVNRATVREAWVSNPDRSLEELESVIDSDRRVGVLTAAAVRDLPSDWYRRILDQVAPPRQRHAFLAEDPDQTPTSLSTTPSVGTFEIPSKTLLEALIANPKTPSDVVADAVALHAHSSSECGRQHLLSLVLSLNDPRSELLDLVARHTRSRGQLTMLADAAVSNDARRRIVDKVVSPIEGYTVEKFLSMVENYRERSEFHQPLQAATALGSQVDLSAELRVRMRRIFETLYTTLNIDYSSYRGHYNLGHLLALIRAVIDLMSVDTDLLDECVQEAATGSVAEIETLLQCVPKALHNGLVRVALRNPAHTPEAFVNLLSFTGQRWTTDDARAYVRLHSENPPLQAAALYLCASQFTGNEIDQLIATSSSPTEVVNTLIRLCSTYRETLPLWISVSQYSSPQQVVATPLETLICLSPSPTLDSYLEEKISDHLGSCPERWAAFESIAGAARGTVDDVLAIVDTISPKAEQS